MLKLDDMYNSMYNLDWIRNGYCVTEIVIYVHTYNYRAV